MSDLDRLMKFVEPVTESGCWIWTGHVMSNGYGQFRLGGKAVPAHRAAYILIRGVTPEKGIDLDHLCRVRCCVNPDHLEPVTRSENLRRGAGCTLIGKTKCSRGHALPENLFFAGTKKAARCRLCVKVRVAARPVDKELKAERQRQQYLKNREKRLAYAKAYQEANRERVTAYSKDWKRRKRASARQMEPTQA